MASGVKNVNFSCIIRTKETAFDNLTHVVFWTKAELVYKNPWKRSVFKSQFQNPPNLGEKKCFFGDSQKNNFKFTTEKKKKIKHSFTPTTRWGFFGGTSEILCSKN